VQVIFNENQAAITTTFINHIFALLVFKMPISWNIHMENRHMIPYF